MITIILILVVAGGLALGVWSYMAQDALEDAYDREGRAIAISGGSLNVLDLGPRGMEGPTVVLIHGATTNLKDLKVSLGDRLARDCRVILIDRPGHGWSERIDRDGIHTPEGQAIAVNEVLVELGVERPLIVGHSWGGALALSYALSYPEDVGGVVAIAPVSHPWPGGVSWVYRLAAMRGFGWLLTNLFAPTIGRLFMGSALRRGFSPEPVPDDYVDATALPLILYPRSFRATAQDMVELDSYLADQSIYYGQIGAPVVIITGDRDRVVSRAVHSDRLASDIPGARLVVMADVGHMAHHVSPNVIVFEIKRLAERIWPQRARA